MALAAVLLAAAGAGSYFGYDWYRQVPLQQVAVLGNVHAGEEALLELMAVDSVRAVSEVDADLIADRVRRHPWVRDAVVTRWATGTLQVRVIERVPVLLVLSRAGRPQHYLDEDGFAMPLVPGLHHDVPLLRGTAPAEHPLRPISDERILALARDVAALGAEHQAILSEFELKEGEIWLRTSGSSAGQSLQVRLGRSGFKEKVHRLHAFWHQAVQTQPDTKFDMVDLRFDSQIVTRERPDRQPGRKLN